MEVQALIVHSCLLACVCVCVCVRLCVHACLWVRVCIFAYACRSVRLDRPRPFTWWHLYLRVIKNTTSPSSTQRHPKACVCCAGGGGGGGACFISQCQCVRIRVCAYAQLHTIRCRPKVFLLVNLFFPIGDAPPPPPSCVLTGMGVKYLKVKMEHDFVHNNLGSMEVSWCLKRKFLQLLKLLEQKKSFVILFVPKWKLK